VKTRPEVDEIAAEFEGVVLGDERLNERLKRITKMVGMSPADSFPEQMGTEADLEALYRFLANPKVTLDGVLKGHLEQTRERIEGRTVVRVVHDTSRFRFLGERDGLGPIRGDAKGFFGHFALAVSAEETREPLGVLGVRPFIHEETQARRKMTKSERVMATLKKPRDEKESSRWEKLAGDTSRVLPVGVRAIHVMDQEADDYDLFAELLRGQLGFVVRVHPERRTADQLPTKEVLAAKPAKLFRTVPLTARDARKGVVSRNRHPARVERDAKLRIRWAPITLQRGQYNQAEARELSLWAVHVFEPAPPVGEEAIEWMLFSSEPVTTLEGATAVVDHYRARWLIEEYFKALKTGCAFEKRQLMTFEGLVRTLGIFVPMAWQLLLLRHLGRKPQSGPADKVLNEEQLTLLRVLLLTKRKYELPRKPSVRDAMLGVARLGGHIKNNGDPGWIVLGRGFTKFVEAEEVWRLARAAI
jgi:hypothetical protein